MGYDRFKQMNARIYDPKWNTPERLEMIAEYDAKYGADIEYLPPSWIDVVGPVLDDIVKAIPETRFVQVKEKWGFLRIYMEPRNPAIEDSLETFVSFFLISRDVYAIRT